MLITVLSSTLLVAAMSAPTGAGTKDSDPFDGLMVQQPLGHDGPQTTYYSTVDGVDRTTTVDKVMLSSSPRWLPEIPIPALPLTIPEAVEAARIALPQAVRDPSKWGIVQVALERFGLSCLYVVRWRRIDGGTKDFLQVPVLVTGRAIPLDPKGDPPK